MPEQRASVPFRCAHVGLLALLVTTQVSCAADDASGPAPSGGVGSAGTASGGGNDDPGPDDDDVLTGPCATEGETRTCQGKGDFGCIDGEQTCVDGQWTGCLYVPPGRRAQRVAPGAEDGRVGTPGGVENRIVGASCEESDECIPANPGEYCSGTVAPITLARTGECAEIEECGTSVTTPNACLFDCHAVAPIPAALGPVVPGAGLLFGLLAGLPAAITSLGTGTCGGHDDCQFDYHCDSGTCVPSAPGYSNGCAGSYDLTLGVPCTDGSDTSVVLCNRGGDPAPVAELNDYVVQYSPVPSGGSIFTGGALGTVEDECPVVATADLASGACINIDCPIPAGLREVYLRRSPNVECGGQQFNNFTYTSGGACGQASCGGGVNVAQTIQLKMFTWIDRSGSMTEERQDIVCEGLQQFVNAPETEGMFWDMRFWPDGQSTCGNPVSDCSTGCDDTGALYAGTLFQHPTGLGLMAPNTPFTMPCGDADSGRKVFLGPNGGICEVGDDGGPGVSGGGRDGCTYNGTPTEQALGGAHRLAAAYKDANPSQAVVVVIVTDGEPSGCGGWGAIWPIASTALSRTVSGSPRPVFTAVVGINPGAAFEASLHELADRGGTDTATLLYDGDPPDALVDAMEDIRDQFACRFEIPAGTDPANVDVTLNVAGLPTPLTPTGTCGPLGLNFEVSGSPLAVTLCPAACLLGATIGNVVEVIAGCGPVITPVLENEEFSAVGACDGIPGTYPEWKLMFYEADVPAGSSIEVTARTYRNGAWGASHPIVEITDANETTTVTSPTRLDIAPNATYPGGLGEDRFAEMIDIQFETNVTGGAPTLLSYEVQFACAASE